MAKFNMMIEYQLSRLNKVFYKINHKAYRVIVVEEGESFSMSRKGYRSIRFMGKHEVEKRKKD